MISTSKNSKRLDTATYEVIIRQAREERARYLAGLFSNGIGGLRQFGRWPSFVLRFLRSSRPAQHATGADTPC